MTYPSKELKRDLYFIIYVYPDTKANALESASSGEYCLIKSIAFYLKYGNTSSDTLSNPLVISLALALIISSTCGIPTFLSFTYAFLSIFYKEGNSYLDIKVIHVPVLPALPVLPDLWT